MKKLISTILFLSISIISFSQEIRIEERKKDPKKSKIRTFKEIEYKNVYCFYDDGKNLLEFQNKKHIYYDKGDLRHTNYTNQGSIKDNRTFYKGECKIIGFSVWASYTIYDKPTKKLKDKIEITSRYELSITEQNELKGIIESKFQGYKISSQLVSGLIVFVITK